MAAGGFDFCVEIAFNAGFQTAATSRTWTDVTDYVEGPAGINIVRGRQDERSETQPSTCTLTLDNTDGRFTPENVAGAYYPNVKRGRPVRVTVSPLPNGHFDDDASGWSGTSATVARVTSPVRSGKGAMGVTATATTNIEAVTTGTGTSGRPVAPSAPYSASAWVRAATAGRTTQLKIGWYDAAGALISTTNGNAITDSTTAWSRVEHTVTSPANAAYAQVIIVWYDAVSGETHYVDDVMLGSVRFLGYVNEWPVAWPGETDTYSTATITATSRLGRLGRAAEFRSIVEEEILYANNTRGTKLYYPLGEPQGAVSAGNASKHRQGPLTAVQVGSGGTIDFGTGTGPGTDGLSTPTFTRVDASNGQHLQMVTSAAFGAGIEAPLFGAATTVGLEAFITTSTVADQTIALIDMGGSAGQGYLMIGVNSAGRAFASISRDGSAAVTVTNNTIMAADGLVHHVALRLTWSDTPSEQATPHLIVDGSIITGVALAWADDSLNRPFGWFDRLSVGGPAINGSGGLFNGTISHVAVLDTPAASDIQRHEDAGANGFAGERSDQRISRYARLAGIPTAEVTVETGLSTTIAHLDITGKAPVAVMHDIERTEDGLLFDGRSGNLTFHARSHRYNSASVFTIAAGSQELEGNVQPKLDDQKLVNDVTISRASGISVRAIDTASIDENGYYRETFEMVTTSDAEVQSAADWRVGRYATPRIRIPGVEVDVINTAAPKAAAILAADLGSRFTLSGLPSQAPASSIDFFIEGTTESITHDTYRIAFNTSPVALSNVWQLDSATYSVLDTSTILAY